VWPLNLDVERAGMAEIVDGVADFFQGLIRCLEFELTVEVTEAGGSISVNITGSDRGALLSNGASLLNNLEYLANKVFRTGKREKISVINLGSDSYRQHREAELVLLAQMASKKVLAQRRPLNLQPMIPKERRIIHLALAAVEGVTSRSEGEGDSRCITIYPA
jgi:spoIIIJ-associated protein